MDEVRVDLDQELVAIQLAEPLDPTDLLVLHGRVVREGIDIVLILIGLAVVILLHCLHLLLLGGLLPAICRRLHRRLFVETCCFHFQFMIDQLILNTTI